MVTADAAIAPLADATTLADPDFSAFCDDHGHALVRGALPLPLIEAVAAEAMAACAAQGWLQDPTQPTPTSDAALSGNGFDDPGWLLLQQQVLGSRAFTALNESAAMLDLMARLFGEPARGRCGDVVRVTFPGGERLTTPAHQDHHYIGGSARLWVAWLPLLPCPLEVGPIALLDRSHRDGPLPHDAEPGSDHPGVRVADGATWCAGEVHPGDVVLMHCLAVHKALPNRTQERIRLSLDCRFLPVSAPPPGARLV